ncbi:hypothetical protein LCGC14_0834110 [marine sediment metagenome]|uniref:Head-tail adaptor protein n=1 Tax=marine sediment metagenome TaxID=412755 RepID=A0A0F9Q0C0_9ZZZZ
MRLRDIFSVMRSSVVSDGIGGFSETLVVGRSDVAGYLRQLTGEELVIFAQKNKRTTHKLYCSDISITISDVVQIRQYGDPSRTEYEIESIDQRRNLGSGHKRLMHIELYRED